MTDAKKWRSLQEMADASNPDPGGKKVRMCLSCGRRLFYVVDTWPKADGTIRRRLKCSFCGHVKKSSENYDP